MKKVITYGTYDLLHFGHIRLLERAKSLGDYLIVGVTADDFDKERGKINVQQTLMERLEAVRACGIADEIIIEEYEGQKIDDIKRYEVDAFAIGSDWTGKFDYLKDYCQVVYLPRTEGISSSEIRSNNQTLRIGLFGNGPLVLKMFQEAGFVNGAVISAVLSSDLEVLALATEHGVQICSNYEELLTACDSVYIRTSPKYHKEQIENALRAGKHVLVESPVSTDKETTEELFDSAREKNLILMESLKTAFSTAYSRLLLMIKTGAIGSVVSIDSVCTSLSSEKSGIVDDADLWSGFEAWAPTAMLPILQILGTNNCRESFISCYYDVEKRFDKFTQMNFVYPSATAAARIGVGAKAEGQLIISGTKGYVYVPAPWWKTDYFELRYENQNENKRYFYQLEGEGIRYEIVSFVRSINNNRVINSIDTDISCKIADIYSSYREGKHLLEIVF